MTLNIARAALLGLLLTSLISACGQKGPLYLPTEAEAAPPCPTNTCKAKPPQEKATDDEAPDTL